jgi:hypothetical protein
VPGEITVYIPGAEIDRRSGEGLSDKGHGLREVFTPVAPHHFPIGGAPVIEADIGFSVQFGDPFRQAVHFLGQTTVIPLNQDIEHAIFRESFHLNGVINNVPGAVYRDPPSRVTDFHHSEVDVRAEAAVESHLFLAIESAPIESGKIEETEIDRLFDFIDVPVGKIQAGYMGFPEIDRAAFFGINGRAQKSFMQGLAVHADSHV